MSFDIKKIIEKFEMSFEDFEKNMDWRLSGDAISHDYLYNKWEQNKNPENNNELCSITVQIPNNSFYNIEKYLKKKSTENYELKKTHGYFIGQEYYAILAIYKKN